MYIKFLQDFQGTETNNIFYLRGQVVDVPEGVASRCILDERAVRAEGDELQAIYEEAVTEEKPVIDEVVADEPIEGEPIMTSATNGTDAPSTGKRGRK